MTVEQLTAFFGWLTVINLVIYLFTVFTLLAFKDKFSAMHAKLFGMSADEVRQAYFSYIARYKTIIIAFNLAPYLVLRFFVL